MLYFIAGVVSLPVLAIAYYVLFVNEDPAKHPSTR